MAVFEGSREEPSEALNQAVREMEEETRQHFQKIAEGGEKTQLIKELQGIKTALERLEDAIRLHAGTLYAASGGRDPSEA